MIRAHTLLTDPGDDTPDLTVRLDYEGRYRRRAVLTAEGGETVLLDLAEAKDLPHGAVIAMEDGRRLLIQAAAEPVAEAHAIGPALTRLAWHVGNRHTPCQIFGDRIRILRDHVLEGMLRGLGAEIEHLDAPFQPEGGAYGHGRTHGHAHTHSAHDDPNAHIAHRHD